MSKDHVKKFDITPHFYIMKTMVKSNLTLIRGGKVEKPFLFLGGGVWGGGVGADLCLWDVCTALFWLPGMIIMSGF